jgi:hypothetical protein
MKISLEHEFSQYLKLMDLPEHKMPSLQLKTAKQAFYGGIARFIVLIPTMADLEEKEAMKAIEDVNGQILDFFTSEM